jgi:hypothetical protein
MAKNSAIVTVSSNPLLVAAQARHEQLAAEMNALNSFIESLGGDNNEQPKRRKRRATASASGGKRGRPKGSKNKPKPETKASNKTERKASSGKRGRPKGSSNNGMSLIRAVATVLAEASEPLKVADIATAVNKLGYKSSAATFKTMISQTLGKLSEAKVAETTARGVWQSSNGISKFLDTLNSEAASENATNDNIPI